MSREHARAAKASSVPLLSNDAREDPRMWLLVLDLYVEPFVPKPALPACEFDDEARCMVLGCIKHSNVGPPPPRLPPWVTACWEAARIEELPSGDESARTIAGHAYRTGWRHFLVLLTRDHELRQAIDAVGRLGDAASSAAYVAPLKARFVGTMAAAPQHARWARLQARRARRLDGRAARPSDAAYRAEASPPRRKKPKK